MQDFQIINRIQTEIVVIDRDMTIVEANDAFIRRHNYGNKNVIGSKCFHSAYNFSINCGYKEASACPVRKSFLTKKAASAIHNYWINDHAVVEELTTTPIIEKNGDVNFVIEVYRDITKLLGLKKGIISICSYCRKIRDEDGKWVSFEAYLEKYTGAKISHGMCEDCHDHVLNKFKHDKCHH